MSDFTTTELNQRIERLQDFLKSKNISLAIITQNTDIYYYTGSVQPLYLVVPKEKPPLVLLRKGLTRAKDEIVHIDIEPFHDTKELAAVMKRFDVSHTHKVGFTLDTVSYATVTKWLSIMNFSEIIDISWDIRLERIRKSEAELDIQKRAGIVMAKIPELVRAHFTPNMTELELSAVIENYFRLSGHGILIQCRKEGIECLGVCSSGSNTLAGTKFDGICTGMGVSPAIPYGASYARIAESAAILLDFCFNLNGYHLDQTRMASWTRPSNIVLDAYDAMREIEKALTAFIKPGIGWSDVYDRAIELARSLGYEREFMGLDPEKVRFVGHGVGLELDEPPFLAPRMEYTIEENMVMALEPKVSIPGIGVIGIEDTVVVNHDGCDYITTCDRDFLVIE